MIQFFSHLDLFKSLQIGTVSAKPTISHDLRREFGGAGFEGGQLGCGHDHLDTVDPHVLASS